MANTLSKTGIVDNSTIRTWHITQSINAFTGTQAYDITLSGSLTVNGPLLPNSSITGTLITSASYAPQALYASNILSSSVSSYANVSTDTLVFQLHHGIVQTPAANTIYYFAINPITGSTGGTLQSDPGKVGSYAPVTLRILSASLSTTVNGTLGSNESSSYSLAVGGNSFNLKTFNHNASFTSSVTSIGSDLWSTNEAIYVAWRTPPVWTTPATLVAHNLVLYCTRLSSSI
jgi:hypothetical protein